MSSPEAHRVCSSRSWKNRIPLHRPASYKNFLEGTSVYLFTITKNMMCLLHGSVNSSKSTSYVVNAAFILQYWKTVANKNPLFAPDMSSKHPRKWSWEPSWLCQRAHCANVTRHIPLEKITLEDKDDNFELSDFWNESLSCLTWTWSTIVHVQRLCYVTVMMQEFE